MKSTRDELEQRDLLAVAEKAAGELGAPLELMLSRDRSRKPSEARRRFYALLKADGWSLGRIGRLVGRCHTTILHELRVHAGNRPKRKRAAKT